MILAFETKLENMNVLLAWILYFTFYRKPTEWKRSKDGVWLSLDR